MRFALIALIRAYQALLSPHLAGACRHAPSCSAFAIEAIEKYGAWRGARLALRRLAHCHPLGSSGYDPVP